MNRPICKRCNVRLSTSRGGGRWHDYCSGCKTKPWIVHKGDSCDLCGFVPVHKCQLDVDHIDGNKANGDTSNLQTLCANCHRLKTYLNADWETKESKEMATYQQALSFNFSET